MSKLYVGSEVGHLRRVLLNRPERALTHLTPSNCHELLFDDVLAVEDAGKEHDAFAYLRIQPAFEAFENNKILIKVKDNGEGIKEEHIDRLFERFYRVDQSRSRDQGGSGLGLSIVKGLIEILNGKIYFDSELGKGTTFFIEIPLKRFL